MKSNLYIRPTVLALSRNFNPLSNWLRNLALPRMMAGPAGLDSDTPHFSAFRIVDGIDRWPYFQRNPGAYKAHMLNFHYFLVAECRDPLGYIHNDFVHGLHWSNAWAIDAEKRTVTLTQTTFESRTQAIQETLRSNYEQERVVRKLFNEDFPLCDSAGEHILDMDGCGVDLFGVVSYGVHMTGFVRRGGQLLYWVPRRSFTKLTFPGLLDNFVSGNLISTESPQEGMIREVFEETGIAEDYTRAHMEACGTVCYQMTVTNDGRPGCQHHCQYVYEMELDDSIIPHRHDGEVESFSLMTLDEVQKALMNDEFTPNRMMTYVAHFVRHGIVRAENESRYSEVCARLHRKHDLFMA